METREIWDNVERAVFNRGTSLKAVAEKSGISYRTLVNWRLKNRLPDIEEARRIAEALGMNIEVLFYGKATKESELKEYSYLLMQRMEEDDPILFRMVINKYGTFVPSR